MVVNKVGGIISVWKGNVFTVEEVFSCDGFLGLRGKWKGISCFIVNVYSPSAIGEKMRLWGDFEIEVWGSYLVPSEGF